MNTTFDLADLVPLPDSVLNLPGPQYMRQDFEARAEEVAGRDIWTFPVPGTNFSVAWLRGGEYTQLREVWDGESDGRQIFDIVDQERPDTVVGGVSEAILRWVIVFAATRRAAGTAGGAGRVASAARTVGSSAVADFTAFDPHEERLADLLIRVGEDNPALDNMITQYLEADETDSTIEGRLKNAIEGAFVGAVADGLFHAVRWARHRRGVRRNIGARNAAPEGDTPLRDVDPPEAEQPRSAGETLRDAEPQRSADETADETRPTAEDPEEELWGLTGRPGLVLSEQVAERVRSGNLSEAENLLDFNANTIDWETVGANVGDGGEGIRRLLNTVSEVMHPLTREATGGVQSVPTTQRLADAVGGSPQEIVTNLHRDLRGDQGIAARMLAADRVLLASAERLRSLAQAAARDGAKEADHLALFNHIELHGAIQAQIKGSRTEIARALHAMRVVRSASEASFTEVEHILREGTGMSSGLREGLVRRLARANGLNEINRLTRRSRYQRWRDAAIEVYINGLLSSLSTHTLNNISNSLKVVEGISERFIAAGFGLGRNMIRRAVGLAPKERVAIREANALVLGTIHGVETALGVPIRAMLREARQGNFSGALDLAREAPDGNVLRSLTTEQPVIDPRIRVDLQTRRAIDAAGDSLNARAIRNLGRLIRIPGRLLITSDEFFKNIAYYQELYARAYREAAEQADIVGTKGPARQRQIARSMRRTIENPPENLHLESIDFARYQTFQSDFNRGGFADSIERFVNNHPLMRFVIPFFRTPVNIVNQTVIERTPLGLILGKQQALLRQIAGGGHQADIALARVATGSAFMGMGVMWALEGKITGSGSTSSLGYNSETGDNIPPYSIWFNGRWYQYNRLEPLGMLMGLSADIADAIMNWDPDEGDNAIKEAAVVALTVITSNITDKTWFRGVSDLVEALDSPNRNVERYFNNLTTTFVTPYSSLLRRINAEHDPIAREAWSWMDQWRRNIPGLSDDLPPRRDFLGDIRMKTDYLGPAWVSPIAQSEGTDDPLRQELARLAFDYRMPDRDLFGIGRDVTNEQYSEFLRIRGHEEFAGASLQEALRELIDSDEYREFLSDDGRTVAVQRLIGNYTRSAKARMLTEDEDLYNLVQQRRLEARQLLIQE